MKKFIKSLFLVLLCITIVISTVACGKKDNYITPPQSVESQRENVEIENPYGDAYRAYYLGEKFIEDFYFYNDGLGGGLRYSLAEDQGYGSGGCWNQSAFAQMLMRLIKLYPNEQKFKDILYDNIESYYDVVLGPLNPYHDASKWAGKVIATHSTINGKKNDGNGFVSWDDEMWMLRTFIDGYEVFGKEDYLVKAKNMCDFCIEDAYIPELGCFYWCDDSNIIAPISNAPIARELLRMYDSFLTEEEKTDPANMIEGKHKYLYYAEKAYNWTMQEARNENNGCFHDFAATTVPCSIRNSTENISIVGWNGKFFNYTSGSMISAAVWFYKVTGDTKYLDDAVDMMNDMFKYFALPYEIDGHTYYFYPSEGNSQWMNSITLFGVYELSEYRYEDCKPIISSFADGINYGFDHFLLDGYISPYYMDGWLKGFSRCDVVEGKDASGMVEMFALVALAQKGVY